MTTLEEAEHIVKVERAKKRLQELEKAFDSVKNELANAESLEDLVKVMSRVTARFNNARSVIAHSQE